MTRNLKALGLALVAVLAMAAVSASAASAQTNGKITSDGPATLIGVETGVGQNALTSFGAKVECPGSTYTGHEVGSTTKGVPANSSTATITPHYKQTKVVEGKTVPNCVGTLNTTATVDMNGCDYVLTIKETTPSPPEDTYGVEFHIVCPEGKEITVTLFPSSNPSHTGTPLCTLHVPPQSNLKGADIRDTTNTVFDLTGIVKGITVKQTRHSILCPAGTHSETGEFHLDVSITEKNNTHITITH